MSSSAPSIAPATGLQVEAIHSLEERRYAAMLRGDAAALSELLANDFIYTHSSGMQDDKRAFIEKVAARRFLFHSIDHEVVGVTRVGSAFIVHGRMRSSVDVDGRRRELDNLSLAIWSSDQPDARIVAYASTPKPVAT